jgi:hypothetical protein
VLHELQLGCKNSYSSVHSVILETRSHHAAQAGFKLLGSSSPPALVSHVVGTIGMSHSAWLPPALLTVLLPALHCLRSKILLREVSQFPIISGLLSPFPIFRRQLKGQSALSSLFYPPLLPLPPNLRAVKPM